MLRPDGLLAARFFLFKKRYSPMMRDLQNALYINIDDPWNTVIVHRECLETSLRHLGLGVVRAEPPALRGFQWLLHIRPLSLDMTTVPLPEDRAPFGRVPPPVLLGDPSLVGRQAPDRGFDF
jgi:hypothetical protein